MPYSEQQITSVHKWSDKTFSFTTTRPTDFHFKNGEFVTLGLKPEGKLIARAYSIVSTSDVQHLEFLSIHVPEGPLTGRLALSNVGDGIWINSKTTGSLTLQHVLPGRHLYMLATGTGLAPFMSLLRSPETYAAYERVILVHSVRTIHELAYRQEIEARSGEQLRYVPTVTREPFSNNARGADLFRNGELFAQLELLPAEPALDRVMICGNPQMNREMVDYLNTNGWTMTNFRGTGNYSVETAFVL